MKSQGPTSFVTTLCNEAFARPLTSRERRLLCHGTVTEHVAQTWYNTCERHHANRACVRRPHKGKVREMDEEKKKENSLELIIGDMPQNFGANESGTYQLAADLVSAFLSAKSVKDLKVELKEVIDKYANGHQDGTQDETIDQLRERVNEHTQDLTDEELAEQQEEIRAREKQEDLVTEDKPEPTDEPEPQDEAPTEHTIDELKDAMRSGDENAVSKILDDLRAEANEPQAEEAESEEPSIESEIEKTSKDERYLQNYGEMQGLTPEDFEEAAAKSALIADGLISADNLDPNSAVDGLIMQADKLSESQPMSGARTASMLRHVADKANSEVMSLENDVEHETLINDEIRIGNDLNPEIKAASSYLAQYAEINAVDDGRNPIFDIAMAKDLAAARDAGIDIQEIRDQVESQVPADEHKLAAFDLLDQADRVAKAKGMQPEDTLNILEGASKTITLEELGADDPSFRDGRRPAKSFDLSKLSPIVAMTTLGATAKDVFAELRENFPKVAADLREHAPEIGAKFADTAKHTAVSIRNGVNTISPTLATGMDQLVERGIAIHNSSVMTAARHGAKSAAIGLANGASGFAAGFKEGLESGKAESLDIDDDAPQMA